MERKQTILSAMIGTILAALVLVAHHAGWMNSFELKTLDLRFKIRGRMSPKLPIVLVSIDQDSFDELNLPWPWPRTLHAALIRKLTQGKPKIIALDILFTEPKADANEDRDLSAAIAAAGNVVLAAELTEVASDFGPKMTLSLPITPIRERAAGYGPVNLITDQDGIVRSALTGMAFQDRIYSSFAYRIYQHLERNGSVFSAAVLVNFRGGPRTYPVAPYYRVLKGEIDPAFFRDKIVLVGAFAPSLHDVFPTPFSASQPMAGAEIQANFVETLWTKDAITPFSGHGHHLIFILVCAASIWVSIKLRPLKALLVALALGGAYAFACQYLFWRRQLWLPAAPTLLGLTLSYGGVTIGNYVREQKQRLRLHAMFSKYVSPDVVTELLEDREGLGLGGKRRHITVLFSDLRGFTSISEQLAPEQVVSLLSDYLAQVTEIVFKHGGTVDKFMGDGVMAIFGAPKAHPDNAVRAVRAGLELVELVRSLNPKWANTIGRSLKVGVGINSGEAVVGSIGSEIRSDFTAIGDTVNLASRLEGLTKEMGVPLLISDSAAAEVKDSIPLRSLRQVKVTGRESPLMVYTPESILGDDVVFATDTTLYVQQHK